jgi:hypothetical protein
MSITGRIVQGTATYLLAQGVITIVSRNYGDAKEKIKERIGWTRSGPVAGEDIVIKSGHHGLVFTQLDELPARISLQYGDLLVDLTKLLVGRPTDLSVRLGSGALRLKLPANQNWVVAYSVKRGTFLRGQERRMGQKLVGRHANTPVPGGPVLSITVDQTNGLLKVN